MTKEEALKMCLEYIETNAHERRHVRWAIKDALAEPEERPWVGLTDEEIKYCLGPEAVRIPPGWSKLTRAIEAKLKKKNT